MTQGSGGLAARTLGMAAVVRPAIAPLFALGLALDSTPEEDGGAEGASWQSSSQLMPHAIATGVMHNFAGLPKNSFLQQTVMSDASLPEWAGEQLENAQPITAADDLRHQFGSNYNDSDSAAVQSIQTKQITPLHSKMSTLEASPRQHYPRHHQPHQSLRSHGLPSVTAARVDQQSPPPTFSALVANPSAPEIRPPLVAQTPVLEPAISNQPHQHTSPSTSVFSLLTPQVLTEQSAPQTQNREFKTAIRPENLSSEKPSDRLVNLRIDTPLAIAPSHPPRSIENDGVLSSSTPTSHYPNSNLERNPAFTTIIRTASTPLSEFNTGNSSQDISGPIHLPIASAEEGAIALPAAQFSKHPFYRIPATILPQKATPLAARLPPPPLPTSAPPPTIQITIGRIEVRTTPRPVPARSVPVPRPQVSLQDYLQQRSQKD
ncbi:MAG TPA: hypothetical protein IGS37_15760 [Synechococcales cyanobacterium M55_K2018_004]|nr:hypothetical protein [Synechococcales cyanobacterium M55_K2018_004]